MYKRLELFLNSRQAKYKAILHRVAVAAQAQASVMHAAGMRVGKVLIVKERDGFIMAVVPAATQVDLDRLKGLIGHDDIRLATIEEVRAVVPDCMPGSIPPFGALYGLRTFVDRQLLTVPEVTVPAGSPSLAIRLRSMEFRRLLDGQAGDFAVPEAVLTAGGVMRDRVRRRPAGASAARRRGSRRAD
jgi:Ala-tRNA(Pro) deacylase